MGLVKFSNEVLKYYNQEGFLAVKHKSKEFLWKKIHQVYIAFWWKIYGDKMPNEIRDSITMWQIYLFLKSKYTSIINAQNDYLINFQKQEEKTPKIIWWCWLQGEEQAPPLCKATLASLQQNYPDYDIRVVTSANLHQYVHMPDYIDKKFQTGKMSAAHYSDILRTLLLIEYGGAWIDSTVFSSKRAADLLEEPLFFYQMFMRENKATICSNWMIVARPNHPALLLMRDLLFKYWQEHNYTIHYFLYHLFFHMAMDHYHELWNQVPLYSNVPVHVLQKELFEKYDVKRFEQITRMADFHKLTHHRNASTEGDISGTNYEHIIKMMGEQVDE